MRKIPHARAPAPGAGNPVDRLEHKKRGAARKRNVAPGDPNSVAARLEKAQAGFKDWLARRSAIRQMARSPEEMATKNLAQVKDFLTRREWEVCLLWLGHYSLDQITAAAGYGNRGAVSDLLKRPAPRRFIELVEAAQLERIISGEFGVRAQARAAGPRVMERVIEKAGGKEPGKTAQRDSDMIRAADLVLTVGGEKVERSEHHHVHELIRTLSPEELRRLAEQNEWPERLKSLVKIEVDTPDENEGP